MLSYKKKKKEREKWADPAQNGPRLKVLDEFLLGPTGA